LQKVLALAQAGVPVLELCRAGDSAINSLIRNVYKKMKRADKGVAFPTCVSVNNCVQHLSPVEEDTDAQATRILQSGDVVKIELAVHVDGYVASAAHTTLINPTPAQPFCGRQVDAICAAYFGAEAAMRLIRPGNSSRMVVEAVRQAAECYRCEPVEGTSSGTMKRYVLSDVRVIPNRIEVHNDVEDFEFEHEEVYTINVVMSTGTGKVREHATKTGIYQRNLDTTYHLRLKSARALFGEVTQQHPVFPFAFRAIGDVHLRAGLSECVNHKLLLPRAIDRVFSLGEYVAQFKMTVVCSLDGPLRLTAAQQLPYIHSSHTLEPTSELGALMQLPVAEAKKDDFKLIASVADQASNPSSVALLFDI
ncbi:putative proliferation-associated 2g4, partial [Thamnocephalis sphaerospora]